MITKTKFTVDLLNGDLASVSTIEAVHAFERALYTEQLTNGCVQSGYLYGGFLQFNQGAVAVARAVHGEILGLIYTTVVSNQLFYHLAVLPAYRNQGVDAALLDVLISQARKSSAPSMLLMTPMHDQECSFAQHLDAHQRVAIQHLQLVLPTLDSNLLREWQIQVQIPQLECNFCNQPERLALWQEQCEGISRQEDATCAERLWHKMMERTLEEDAQFWSVYLDEKEHNRVVGYLTATCSKAEPHIGYLSYPQVSPGYRYQELERWLLALMVEKLQKHRREMEFVYTIAPEFDLPLLAVYQELGFQICGTQWLWEVQVTQL